MISKLSDCNIMLLAFLSSSGKMLCCKKFMMFAKSASSACVFKSIVSSIISVLELTVLLFLTCGISVCSVLAAVLCESWPLFVVLSVIANTIDCVCRRL